ncbi:hypothetical protein SH1V18_16090 [Vallitalea longa]|uniref:Sporulation stage II protein D amidase enhancer LytB N-terminal domain-containing protein n=1 Tax=Vallitalea longa TaxID=2936439 RepID=A0A9W5Y9N6_9FIRM|nr:SpoIID/LytB domain-containing protein [Vallitalea longa]GKX29129.1 hypothetical protein SH1V18_16090 [Vallitalea longa]
MKKVFLWLNIIIITITLSCTSDSIYAKGDSDQELRIGLRQCYEHKESIHVNNKILNMGYKIDDEYKSEQVFMSDNGFTFMPASNNYLISLDSYETYEDVQKQAHILMKQDYDVFPGYASVGVWKIYIPIKNKKETSEILYKLNLDKNVAFEIVNDNGFRTIMEFSNDIIVMENTYEHVQFLSMDEDNEVSAIDLGQRQYRGRMEFGRYDEEGITAINIINLDEYLYGVLPSEIPYTWPMEALKAQAVAARNYAVYYKNNNSKYRDKPYILCDTTSSQAYKGYSVENERTNKAVNETDDKLITYQGEVIQATFFSTSGGHTENSENVWNGSVPFLKGVPDIYELEPAAEPWTKEITSVEIKDILAKYDIDIGDITDIIPMDYTESKRVTNLEIIGTTGEHVIKKETIRSWLGLKSRKFTVVKEDYQPRKMFNVMSAGSYEKVQNIDDMFVVTGPYSKGKLKIDDDQLIILSKYNIDNIPLIEGKKDTYTFVGQGYGHGVGMSQSGAKTMAEQGFTYDEILEYYYTGVKIK